MDKHTFLGFLMLSLLIGTALAVDLPSEGQVVVVSGDGVVAGTGMLESGDLELELLADFTGFGTLTIIGEAGEVSAYDVMVQSGGAVVLTESLDDLATLVRGAGGAVDVRLRERGTASGRGAADPDEVNVGEDPEAAEPAATVPERADDTIEEVEDDIGRTADEVGDVDATAGPVADAVEEAVGADDAVGGLGGSDDADGSVEAGTESEPETGAEPGEQADQGDRPGQDDGRGGDALPTPEVPRLP